MRTVILYDSQALNPVRVYLPEGVRPEVIVMGDRVFVKRTGGDYYQTGYYVVPAFLHEEAKSVLTNERGGSCSCPQGSRGV